MFVARRLLRLRVRLAEQVFPRDRGAVDYVFGSGELLSWPARLARRVQPSDWLWPRASARRLPHAGLHHLRVVCFLRVLRAPRVVVAALQLGCLSGEVT